MAKSASSANKGSSGKSTQRKRAVAPAEKSGKTACPKCITGATPTPKPGEDDADGKLYYYAGRAGGIREGFFRFR